MALSRLTELMVEGTSAALLGMLCVEVILRTLLMTIRAIREAMGKKGDRQ